MTKRKIYKLLLKYLKEEKYTFFNKKKQKKRFYCNVSNVNITDKFFFKCKICTDFDISFFFLPLYNNYLYHITHHAFKFINYIYVPIYNLNWSYDEEILLFEGLQIYGIGNWKKISNLIKTKGYHECEKHFLEINTINFKKCFISTKRFYPKLKFRKIWINNYIKMLKIFSFDIEEKTTMNIQKGEMLFEQTNIEFLINCFIINNRIRKRKKKEIDAGSFTVKFVNLTLYQKFYKEYIYCKSKLFSFFIFPKTKASFDIKTICEKIFLKDFFCVQCNISKKKKSARFKFDLIFIKWIKIYIIKKLNVCSYYIKFNLKKHIFFLKYQINNRLFFSKIKNFISQKKYHRSFSDIITRRDKIVIKFFGMYPFQYVNVLINTIFALNLILYNMDFYKICYINKTIFSLFFYEKVTLNLANESYI